MCDLNKDRGARPNAKPWMRPDPVDEVIRRKCRNIQTLPLFGEDAGNKSSDTVESAGPATDVPAQHE